MLLALLIAFTATADVTRLKKYIPERHCGGAHCVDGLRIEVSLKEFLPEKWALYLNGKLLSDECDANRKAGPLAPHGVSMWSEHNGVTIVRYKEWPAKVTVAIADRGNCRGLGGGTFFLSEPHEPKYGKSFPNGLDCGPVCRSALLNVVQ